MTVTTLEPVELPDLDVPIECDSSEGCSALATFVITTFCCPRLLCTPHMNSFMIWAALHLPATAYCGYHPEHEKFCAIVSDFIESVQPL